MTAEDKVEIRYMKKSDLDDVMWIEHDSFTSPWSREAFENELEKNRFALYFVADYENKVVGYCGLWVIADEAHITNIAVHSSMRGYGIGEGLLRAVLQMAKTLNAVKATLEVRLSNEVAQNLYRKYGFLDGGLRKRYYADNQEDALVMWVVLE